MISPIRPGAGRRIFFRTLAVVAVMAGLLRSQVVRPTRTVATFNIEDFPQSNTQVEGAFEVLHSLDAGIVAVQEITDPTRFQREARRRLGHDWTFLYPDDKPHHRLGVLVDRSRYRVQSMRVHDETVVHRGGRPTVEVELVSSESERRLEVFTVHFKSGPNAMPVRHEQYEALYDILTHHGNGDRATLVMGDFNSMTGADQARLSWLAESTSLRWLTRRTRCTSYWRPNDSTCEASTLDHLLAEGLATEAVPAGPCRSFGCQPDQACPPFYRRVSDHCPVIARWVP